ncbi:fungal-specific transcription factor domain-containing protein, partial [Echria macrotheca]
PAKAPPRTLACKFCAQRKTKCDREVPCGKCLKAGVECIPGQPAPTRPRRRPVQELNIRLTKTEAKVEDLTAERDRWKELSMSVARGSTSSPEDWQPAGKLVQESGGVRFMDHPLISEIQDEVRAMRELVNELVLEDEPAMAPDDNADLILGPDTKENIGDLWPDSPFARILWNVYLERVNPLTKIIHVPTLKAYTDDHHFGRGGMTKNIQALFFAIFLMATISLNNDECRDVLRQPKKEILERFSKGVQLTLHRMNFLQNYDLATVQALVIYLISLQGRYDRHAAWIMNGVAIRIAQKLGLHRDGETMGLPPFETEMRRRIWWQIIMVDTKYAFFSGLGQSLLPRNWDTKAPKNLNDDDIVFGATEAFRDADGPTEMVFCLMTYKFAKFLVNTPGLERMLLAPRQLDSPGAPTEAEMSIYQQSCEQLRVELLQILDKWCNPAAGPVHRMAVDMRKFIVDKIQELITPPQLQKEWGHEIKTPEDNAFRIAVVTLEHDEQNYLSSSDKGFIWYSLSHFQMDIFSYMAVQLSKRTDGMLVERAWRQVEVVYTFHPELFNMSDRANRVVGQRILSAWEARADITQRRTGYAPPIPNYLLELQENL